MAKPQSRRPNSFQDNEDGQAHYAPTNRDSVADQDTAPFPVFYKTTAVFPYQNEDGQVHYAPGKRDSIEEQDTAPLAVLPGSTPVVPHQVASNLLMVAQRMFSSGLDRLQDPQPEGLFTRGLQVVKPWPGVLGLLPLLTLTSASGLLTVALSYYLSRYSNQALEFFFFLGLLLIFVPNVVRLLSPAPSRFERICLLSVVGVCCFLVEFMMSPLNFSPFDPMLHWRTADDLLRTGHLFGVNSLLPVSPYFPGLEIVTNASSTISGLSTFQSSIILILAVRSLMALALFMFYEQVTRSSRMAGIATIIYMTNAHFITFDAIFGYETMALPLAIFMFYILARYETLSKDNRWVLFTAWIVLVAVTLTHHMTDYVFDGLLILWTIVSLFRISTPTMRRNLATIALFGVLLSVAYASLVKGNPVSGYLSSYFDSTFIQLGHILAGTSEARPLFASQGSAPAPPWDRLLMMASVAIIAFGIPFGLLSLWRQHRHDALAVTLGMVALLYPITQVLRFTTFGGEITDRSTAFLFLPIAYVLTIFITHFWPTRRLSWRAIALVTCAISVTLIGGVLIVSGPAYSNLPGPYVVEADGRSIEPEGIQAASWSLSHLGPDNRVGTDRDTQTVFSTFGDQRIVNELEDNVDIAPIFYSTQLGPYEEAILREARLRYLVVDLRLSTSLPLLGFYYENDETGAFNLTSPISRESLTKFSAIPKINRVFDSGNIVIYDVGVLVNGSGH